MDNKKLGIALVVFCIIIAIIFFGFKNQIKQINMESCGCEAMQEGGICPVQQNNMGIIDYVSIALIFSMLALGIYLIFFEKGQKEIIKTLENQKKIQTDEEKFEIMIKAMDEYEKKALRAIREQNGITQSTLRYRTDISKSKLSSILTDFERKGLIKRVPKGKTMEIYIK